MNRNFTEKEIEAYVEGSLSPERAKALEQAASKEAKLAKAIQIQKAAQLAILKDAMKADLKEVKKEQQTEQFFGETHQKLEKGQAKSKQISLGLRLAAAAAIIAGIGFLLFSLFPPGEQDLMAQHFSPYKDQLTADIELVIESRNDAEQPGLQRLQQAMQAYNNGNYEEASKLFEQHFRANPLMLDAAKIKLYMGISQLGAAQYHKAELTFETLAHRKDYEYFEAANWYLALAEIKLDKKAEAKEHLQSLSNSKAFAEQAKKLLQAL